MNNQIELSDEQLDLVIGGSTFGSGSSQANNANVVQVPIAIVGPSANVILAGSNNTQFGPSATATAFSFPTQSNS